MNKTFVLCVLLLIVALVSARRRGGGGGGWRAPAAPAWRPAPVSRPAPVVFRTSWSPPPRAWSPPRPVWRPAPRPVSFARPVVIRRPAPVTWGFNGGQICTNQCSATRTCQRGGCAQWTHYTTRTCAKYNTVRTCRRYGAKKVRVCVRGRRTCSRWGFVNQTTCAAVGVWKKPIVKLVNGGCKTRGKRCGKYIYKRSVKCGKHATRCTKFKVTKRKTCSKWRKAKAVCAKWGQAPRMCKSYKNVCNAFGTKVTRFCSKYGKKCTKLITKTKFIPKVVCARRAKICKRFVTRKSKTCAKFVSNGKCKRFTTHTRKVCAQRRRACQKSISVKHRVCKAGTRKCTKYIKQVVGNKCTIWRYNVKKQKRCTRWGRKIIPKQCVGFAKRLRCRAWSTVVSRVNGRKIVTRRCAHSRKVRRIRKGCHFAKKGNRIFKRCGRRVFKCTLKSRKGKKLNVCCTKLHKIIRAPLRRCIKWAPGRAVRTTCKRWSVKKVRTAYCAKRVNRVRKVCARTRGVCTRWGFVIRKRCTKTFSKCTQYVNQTTRRCAQYGQKCGKFIVRAVRHCAGYKNKCVQYKKIKVTKTYKRCAAVARVCTRNAFNVTRVCKNYKRICTSKTPRRRVCLRFKRVGGKCKRWNTIRAVKCVKQQRYCAKPIVRTQRQCSFHVHFCKAYKRVYKTVGYNRKTYCKRWRVKKIRTQCVAYRSAGCSAWRTRITGWSCVGGYTSKRTCVSQRSQTHTRCARFSPPSCQTHTSCRPVCRVVRIRARGDPFMVVGGKWTQFDRVGIFNYFNHGPCNAQLKLERVGQGTQVTGVALKCNDNVFVATPNGITIDGQAAQSGAKFGEKGSLKQLKNAADFRLGTGFGLRILVTLEPKLNMVNFELRESKKASQEFKDEGLMKGGSEEFASEYAVFEAKDSYFPAEQFVQYGVVHPRVDVKKSTERKARQVCKALKNKNARMYGQCQFDWAQTGKDTSKSYLDELQGHNN